MKRFAVVFIAMFMLGVLSGGTADSRFVSQALENEAGFITIEPVNFYLHYGGYFPREVFRSSETKLWYSFHPADNHAEEKPLFVFFNGGPGGATSSGLFSLNTSEWTLDTTLSDGGNAFIPNPLSWTRFGNIIHVDSRTAGFSYSLMPNPADNDARYKEFNAQNYNFFIDGADFVRFLLKFLASHPRIQDNPVVIVGESYGGNRSTAMLHMLLNYKDYADGKEVYQDSDLVDRIQEHYDTVFPGFAGQRVPPDVIASQFGHQVLIQPGLSIFYQNQVAGEMYEQPGSPIYQVAQETGIPFIPCSQQSQPCNAWDNALEFIHRANRDVYYYTKPDNFFWGYFNNAARLLRLTANLSLVTGVDVTTITDMYAINRQYAYKFNELTGSAALSDENLPFALKQARILSRMDERERRVNPGDLSETFGALRPWDNYQVSLNGHANSAFHFNVAVYRGYSEVHPYTNTCGKMFLKNVVHVNTFITNAPYDLVIYAEAIAPSLALHTDILEFAHHDRLANSTDKRPGRIILHYTFNAFPDLPGIWERTIRFPLYASSGHAVSISQPAELLEDVMEWLAETGLVLNDQGEGQ